MLNKDPLQTLLAQCEERLLESRQLVEESLSLVQQAISAVRSDAGSVENNGSALASQRDELVKMVLAALGSEASAAGQANGFLSLLVRCDDGQYRIGRRQLALTESEKQILDLLWSATPDTVDRMTIHNRLYAGKTKAASGTIDVFMSKLRQKLKLAGDGRDLIHSSRGKGWSLDQDLCRKLPGASNDPKRHRA
ncbi:MAG: helix-turn-helix domain-containing protein [Sphingomonas sp.]|uniref:helix-turn-helix domain-containing protein n=1 Tax=Sphingomonas sp. TaxID=28214 RepID=UPI001B26E2F4|nr:helix-turn-helix domain-containing protein [Sphingomonas sp.]MBO9623975.1 helix-turn-helix domain-containing protein [Sphingomonas sp.]